jgi:hypothetical protein
MFQAGLRAEPAALGHLKSAVQESAGNYILTSGSYRLRATILAVLFGRRSGGRARILKKCTLWMPASLRRLTIW